MGLILKPFSYWITFLLTALFSNHASAATFNVRNNCPFTVWAAALPGGGSQLNSGQTWSITVAPGTGGARIWGRTGCSFDGAGRGGCQTGDCGGLLQCQVSGATPSTLAEFALNQFNNLDFFDISLVDGFNLAMEFIPISGGCTRGPRCTADINGQCPNELRVPGGCRNPCCNYSRFFKDRCPDAFSYPDDHQGTDFTCPGGTNYRGLHKYNFIVVCSIILVIAGNAASITPPKAGVGKNEAVDPFCYVSCTETFGNNECLTDCIARRFRFGVCYAPKQGPADVLCCCSP